MKEILVLIFNPYPLNFELSLDQNQHPPLEKNKHYKKEFSNLLREFFLPQLPASRFNIQGFRLSNGA